MNTVYPAAQWSEDCRGKWDYDGPLLSISCRYWSASWNQNGQCSAVASIILNHRPKNVSWREHYFYGQTETEVKRKVEDWIDRQFQEVLILLHQESRRRVWFNRIKTRRQRR